MTSKQFAGNWIKSSSVKDKPLIIFGIVAVLCIGVLLFMNMDKSPRYQWFESYRSTSEQPYGLAFVRRILEGYRPGSKFIVNDKRPIKDAFADIEDPGSTDYIFVGQDIFLDSESKVAFGKFLESGGNALIVCATPPEGILYSIYDPECGESIEFEDHSATTVTLDFYHPDLDAQGSVNFEYRFGHETFPYPWKYVSASAFCDSTKAIAALGHMGENRVNFIRISVGKGYLFIHSNPLVFTNYFLTEKQKANYVSGVFAHLDGKDIIWDDFSKIALPDDGSPYSSPLYYILEQPSLKYAWWLMLLTTMVYVFFAAKRKQRAIPVMEPKTNTSLEFVNMISMLYYKNGNHLDMAHKKMRYFLYFVRSKYGIHAEKFDDNQIRRLAEKSKVELADVEVIFSRFHLIEDKFKNNIEANRLMDLNDSIDHFYRQANKESIKNGS